MVIVFFIYVPEGNHQWNSWIFKIIDYLKSAGLHKIEIGLGTKFQHQFSAWFSRNSYSVG